MREIIILLLVLTTIPGITEGRNSARLIRFTPNSDPKPFIQNNDSLKIWDKLDIQSEPRIKELLRQHVNQNKNTKTTNGYRVQIYFGSGPNAHAEAMRARTEFLSSNPDIKAYLIFKSPDFKVLTGDFRTKSEALKLQKSIMNQFPNAFIVADEIALPELTNSK
jgi:hypothetical protein